MKAPRLLIYSLLLLTAGCADQCDTLLHADFSDDVIGTAPTRNLTDPTVPDGIGYPSGASYVRVFNAGTAANPQKALCFKNDPGSAGNRLVFGANNASVSSDYVVFMFGMTPHFQNQNPLRLEFSDTNILNDNTLLSAIEFRMGESQLFTDISVPSPRDPGGYVMRPGGFVHLPNNVAYLVIVNYNLDTRKVKYTLYIGNRSVSYEHDAIHAVNPIKPRMALMYRYAGNSPADCATGHSVVLDNVFFLKKREEMKPMP